jgi:ribonuclease BN (tRNA processing enzyme)
MRVTVLGSSASYTGPERACSGHLIEAAGARVLFDCGNGVTANLAQIEEPDTLDAIFISHAHPDHFADLYVIQSALRYAPTGPRSPVPLYLPEGLWDRIRALLPGHGAQDIAEAFVPSTLVAYEPVSVGGLIVTPVPVVHADPTFALVAQADGVKFAYSSDTAPCDALREAARGADFFLAEATLPEQYADKAAHLTAVQAAKIAREAGARALGLTHVWPTSNRVEMARHASDEFGSTVVVADEFDTFHLKSRDGKDD